jgi:pSer/pThr/pTyr-binding forkhead associated (FHA) protein
MATKSQLVTRTGPNPGKTFSLNKPEMYIGRDISNDIVINDAEVSRKHVRLTVQGERYVIEDLGSTNGTFINGQ